MNNYIAIAIAKEYEWVMGVNKDFVAVKFDKALADNEYYQALQECTYDPEGEENATDNAFEYLMQQQGYKLTDLLGYLSGNGTQSEFIRSLGDELKAIPDDNFGYLTILVDLDDKTLDDVMRCILNEEERSITLPVGTTLGFYDPNTKFTGNFGIALEKPVAFPAIMLHPCADTLYPLCKNEEQADLISGYGVTVDGRPDVPEERWSEAKLSIIDGTPQFGFDVMKSAKDAVEYIKGYVERRENAIKKSQNKDTPER